MNPELFITFLLITVVLILTPGPVVTLVIATGATDGVRAAHAIGRGIRTQAPARGGWRFRL